MHKEGGGGGGEKEKGNGRRVWPATSGRSLWREKRISPTPIAQTRRFLDTEPHRGGRRKKEREKKGEKGKGGLQHVLPFARPGRIRWNVVCVAVGKISVAPEGGRGRGGKKKGKKKGARRRHGLDEERKRTVPRKGFRISGRQRDVKS